MPYIKPEERKKYDDILRKLPPIETKGELEYCIFKLMKRFMSDKENRYSNQHDCAYGAIHCGDEWRRRYLDIREDVAKMTNGDVEVN